MAKTRTNRVFVPGTIIADRSEGLEAASADETFYVIGPPGRHELAGFLVPIDELDERGIPRNIAREVSMIVSLRTSEHAILLVHEGGLWELLVQSGKGLPDTYHFRALPNKTGKSGLPG